MWVNESNTKCWNLKVAFPKGEGSLGGIGNSNYCSSNRSRDLNLHRKEKWENNSTKNKNKYDQKHDWLLLATSGHEVEFSIFRDCYKQFLL